MDRQIDRRDCVKILSIGKVVEDPTYTLCMGIFVQRCMFVCVCVCMFVFACIFVWGEC